MSCVGKMTFGQFWVGPICGTHWVWQWSKSIYVVCYTVNQIDVLVDVKWWIKFML
jgi:hypothetical protein